MSTKPKPEKLLERVRQKSGEHEARVILHMCADYLEQKESWRGSFLLRTVAESDRTSYED